MKIDPPGTDEVANTALGGWIFPALLALVLLVSAVIAFTSRPIEAPAPPAQPADWTPSVQPQGETVALEVNFGNGARKVFDALPWRAGMTVADLLQAARDFRPGIQFTQQGEGAGGFLTALDGLKNQGASGRNWRYQVDGRNGEASFCLQELQPGVRVLWEFTDKE
jgi:hypothetical protein